MLMLRALRNPSIRLLWTGQVASAIGDEIYRVALVWIAVSYVGTSAGYLAAAQSAVLLLFSLFGGIFSDRWDHFKTLIGVDLLRAGIVMVPYFLSVSAGGLSLTMIWVVALSLAALSAFFDPALQALLPRFSGDEKMLQAATGLMSTTLRLARVAGPSLIGLLSTILPMAHFFAVDALTFLISTLSISFLSRRACALKVAIPTRARKRLSVRDAVMAGFWLATRTNEMSFMMVAKAICGGTWNLAYGLGLALLVRRIAPDNMQAFGWVLGAYGLGNLAAALILGNLPRARLSFLVFSGYLVLGGGFLAMAFAPSVPTLMLAAGFTAIGGPLNDLPFVDLIQSRYRIDEIPAVFRLRTVLDTAATLIGMLLSPKLFALFSIPVVVGACGALTLLVGAVGLLRYQTLASRHDANG